MGTEPKTEAKEQKAVDEDGDDWVVECSDEEMYYGDSKAERGEYYEPSCDDIVNLYSKLIDGEELTLEWESPGRRLPKKIKKIVPVKKKEVLPEITDVEDDEDPILADFEFDEARVSVATPRRPKFGQKTPVSQKRVATLDKVMNDMIRHKKINQANQASMSPSTPRGIPKGATNTGNRRVQLPFRSNARGARGGARGGMSPMTASPRNKPLMSGIVRTPSVDAATKISGATLPSSLVAVPRGTGPEPQSFSVSKSVSITASPAVLKPTAATPTPTPSGIAVTRTLGSTIPTVPPTVSKPLVPPTSVQTVASDTKKEQTLPDIDNLKKLTIKDPAGAKDVKSLTQPVSTAVASSEPSAAVEGNAPAVPMGPENRPPIPKLTLNLRQLQQR